MYKVTWDSETGGVLLNSRIVDGTLGVSPRPVFWEELDLLNLNKLGWQYPHSEAPLLWATNKQYWYRGQFVFEAKGANIYEDATVILQPGFESLKLKPVDVKKMLSKNSDYMFLLESEAIEFIHETWLQYASAQKSVAEIGANQLDYEAMAKKLESKRKQKMAIIKESCDSFDIMPLESAEQQGRKIYQTTKIDRFLASFSGGKDSQVVLDLCTRAIPSSEFEVIYSDTGYELPSSLELYEKTQEYYKAKFPDLIFSLARNHESVLNYWDKIGTPSDTHRWCCSIMKTAPLYRMLKVDGTNKQAKVLTFDGVRAEESVKRGQYERFGKGKHTSIYNAHPILDWNTTEVFLYIFLHDLPINQAYRDGKARVGCIICPFSSAWDDMLANKKYKEELHPFESRLHDWAKVNKIGNPIEFIRDRSWKIKAIGDTKLTQIIVNFSDSGDGFIATVKSALHSPHMWMVALGEYSFVNKDNVDKGTIKFENKLYEFEITYEKDECNYILHIPHPSTRLALLMRRIIYKSSYCINCEVCEVDCPTGALTVTPDVIIDRDKCIHCHKCLTSHDLGCISADSVRMIKNMNNNESTKIQGYKTFGFRSEWLQEYLSDPDYFWQRNSLGSAQLDGFKAWLKDAEINDAKNRLSAFGEFVQKIYQDEELLVWELILTNLSYHSFIVNWFTNNIKVGDEFDRKVLENMINEQGYNSKGKTVANAVAALIQTFSYSPIGDVMQQCLIGENRLSIRGSHSGLSNAGLAYSLYKYAETNGVYSLRVSDFYANNNLGPARVYGIDKPIFTKILKSINSAENRVLIAELSMGLDSITLRDDLTSLSCLENMLQI